jgi:ATP-dependent DNA helicase RecQ
LSENSQRKKEAKKILKSVFGYSSFRDNQEEVIAAIISGKDVFTSMPTGGGKSLCYQIPGLLFEGLTVVISPLIALMKDQVDDAISRGIPAAFLNSSLKSDEISEIYSRLYRKEIKLLYLSPERLAVEGYVERLHNLNVAFFAIDEAHCLSEWGHDFRPDYLFLSHIRDNFPDVPMAAFTATATGKVQDDIIKILKMKNPLTVRASFNRKELYYQVKQKTEVLSQISSFIKNHPDESGIVYRISRKDVEKTAAYLKSRGIKALHYHAGLTKDERTKNQELFNNDDVDVIVATTAFGMG